MGKWALFLGVKRRELEADHSPPSSGDVKECVELYLHSPVCLHGVVLNEAREQLYLLKFTTNMAMKLRVT
jgi:hypothetical protein